MEKKSKITKSIALVIVIFIAIISFPCHVNAELTDGQRTAIVTRAVEIIIEGNKKFLLRYSQDHRLNGYNGTKVKAGGVQTTRTTTSLTDADFKLVHEKYPAAPKTYSMHIVKGADISDTIAYDCSSFVGAVYRDVIGTNFYNATGAYPPSGFQRVSLNQLKPGDILWKKGHVAIYLGDYDNDGVVEMAEAGGIITNLSKIKKSQILRDYILQTGNYKTPVLQLPKESVQLSTKQVRITTYKGGFTCGYTFIGEVKKGTAIDVTSMSTTNTGNNMGSDSDSSVSNGPTSDEVKNMPMFSRKGTATYSYWPEDFALPDEALVNSEGYFHKGIPAYGGYSQQIVPYNWAVDRAENVLDWFFGIVTMLLKAEIIGWTSIAENIISKGLSIGTEPIEDGSVEINENAETVRTDGKAISIINVEKVASLTLKKDINENIQGEPENTILSSAKDKIVSVGTAVGTTIATTKKVTIEDVIFNNVPLLDINFFDFSHAAGKELSSNSPIYKIRQLIANWYNVFRTMVIMLMLVILIYLAIRAALSIALSDKSVEKDRIIRDKLKDWLVGFILVFSIHYIMIGIIYLNNQVVDILKPIAVAQSSPNTGKISTVLDQTGDLVLSDRNFENGSISQHKEDSIYEQIRVMAYEIPAITGWTGTFMYVTMVVYLVIFVFMYIKRLFILAVLTIISPFIGGLYAFNKDKYQLGTWLKEYVYNVIIQLIHAVIYTVLISIAISLAKLSTILGAVLALVFIGFMFTAEGIVKRIFNYNSSTLGSLSNSFASQLAFFYAGKKMLGFIRGRRTDGNEDEEKSKKDKKSNTIMDKAFNSFKQTPFVQSTMEYYKRGEAGTLAAAAYTGERISLAGKKVGSFISGPSTIDDDDAPAQPVKLATYGEQYQKYYNRPKRVEYEPSDELNVKLAPREKIVKELHSKFKKERAKVLGNAVLATASTALTVPILLLDGQKGLAVGFFGIHAFQSAFSRKTIRGKQVKKAKFRGKKIVYFMLSPILAPAYANAINNAKAEKKDYEKIAAKAVGELVSLRKAKVLEQRIEEEIERIYATVPKNKGKLQSNLNIIERRRLKKALKIAVARIEGADVVESIIKRKQEKAFNVGITDSKKIDSMPIELADIEEIRKELNINAPEGIKVSKKLEEHIHTNIRRQLRMGPREPRIIRDKKGRIRTEYRSRIGMEEIEDICDIVADEEHIDRETMRTVMSDLKQSKKFRKSVTSQELREISDSVSKRLGNHINDDKKLEDIRKRLHGRMNSKIDEKTEEEKKIVNDQLAKMNTRQLIDLINESLKAEGNVEFDSEYDDKYGELMKLVRKLDDINTEYKEHSNEKIYKSVEELVEEMRDEFLRE